MERRHFIKNAALASMAFSASSFIVRKRISRYTVALIGCGWWGTNILREAIRSGEVQVVALCDVDEAQIKQCDAEVQRLCTDRPKHFRDFRDCLRSIKPDIVINATPDHWHALIAIEAIHNGAHVFLEKPISHTVKEGTAIEKAARDTQRICIVDFHRRYSPHNVSGMEFLKSGKAGKINEVRAFVNYDWRGGALEEETAVPAGLDWDMYCGPAPLHTYNPSIHPKGFRYYMDFANGLIGDWGPHWFDQVLWWTDEIAPKKIFSTVKNGLRTTRADCPESQLVIFEFEDFHMTWEHSFTNTKRELKSEIWGTFFHGTEGTFYMGWQSGWAFYPNDTKKEIITQPAQLDQPDGQNIRLVWADFMKSIASGQLPHADIAHGRHATNMCLLGNLAAKVGRSIEWDYKNDLILNDPEANKLLQRNYRGEWVYPS